MDLNEYDFKHPCSFYETLNDHIIKTNTVTHYPDVLNDTTKTLISKIALHNNISNENILESCIQINLKNILRYSENYIEAQKHGSFINFNELIENLVITLPESGFSPMFITKNEKWVDPEKQKFIINDNFKRLANNVKISDSYFNYCKYLISLLK